MLLVRDAFYIIAYFLYDILYVKDANNWYNTAETYFGSL